MPRADVTLIGPYPRLGVRHGGISGVASYTANLAYALAGAGASVEVVSPLGDGDRARREQDGPVAVQRAFPGRGGLTHAARAALRTGSPIVHLQHEFFLYGGPASSAGLVGALGALGLRRHTVATLHQVVDPVTVDRGFTELHRVRIPPRAARAGLSQMQGWLRRSVDRVVVHEPAFAEVLPGAAVVPHGVEPAPPRVDRVMLSTNWLPEGC